MNPNVGERYGFMLDRAPAVTALAWEIVAALSGSELIRSHCGKFRQLVSTYIAKFQALRTAFSTSLN